MTTEPTEKGFASFHSCWTRSFISHTTCACRTHDNFVGRHIEVLRLHAVSKTPRTIVGDIGLKTTANVKREGVKLRVESLLVLDDDLTPSKQHS